MQQRRLEHQASGAAAQRHRGALWIAPAAIAAVALFLRLHALDAKPFWLDEIASLRRATMPLPDTVAAALRNNHYPAYFLILWLVAKCGASSWLLRLPSAIFGAISAGLVCAVGREADGLRTGVAAGLLLALSPFDVQLGQDARSYTLAAALILTAMWGLVRLARRPALAAVPLGERRGAAPWFAYCGGTAAALHVLNVAAGWLVAANLAAIVIARRAGAGRAEFLRRWAIAQIVVVSAWLPALLAVYVFGNGSVLEAANWGPPLTMSSLWSVAAPVYLHRIAAFITLDVLPTPVPGLSILIAAMAAYGSWRLRREPGVLAVIVSAAIVLPLLLALLSLSKPIMVPRYFGWSAAPFFILAGAGIGRLPRPRFAVCALGLGVGCLVNLLPYYKAETKPRWDLAVQHLAMTAHDGDLVLLNSWYAQYVMKAFADAGDGAARQLRMTWHPADAAAQLAPRRDFWVVFGRAGQGALPSPEDYLASIRGLGEPIAERRIGRYIVIWHFAPDKLTAHCPAAADCDAPQRAAGEP